MVDVPVLSIYIFPVGHGQVLDRSGSAPRHTFLRLFIQDRSRSGWADIQAVTHAGRLLWRDCKIDKRLRSLEMLCSLADVQPYVAAQSALLGDHIRAGQTLLRQLGRAPWRERACP